MATNGPAPPTGVVIPPQMDDAQGSPVDLRSMLGGVLRRWKLVTMIPLVVLIITYGGMKAVPPQYKSTAEILIFDPQGQIDEAIQKRISPFTDLVDANAMNVQNTERRQ